MVLRQVYDKERSYVKGSSFEAVASGEQPVFESCHVSQVTDRERRCFCAGHCLSRPV